MGKPGTLFGVLPSNTVPLLKESKVLVQEQLAKMEDEMRSLKVTQYDNNQITHSHNDHDRWGGMHLSFRC